MKINLNRCILFVVPAIMGLTEVQAQTTKEVKEPGINVAFFDTKTKPQDNFFRFVNGTWLDQTQIPSDRTSWGSFNELLKKTDKDALDILKEAAKNPIYKSNTDQGKAVNLYKTILDTVARDKMGIKPLLPYLAKIDKVKSVKDLQQLLIEMEPVGGIGFVNVGVGADDKNSTKNALKLGVGSLGLPDQDYYLSEDKDTKEKRDLYEKHVARMLQFIGETAAQAKVSAAKILALEVQMSKPRLSRVERRDDRLQYNPMTIAELQKLTPAINWKTYFDGIGFAKLDTVIVSQPKYMKALQTIFTENNVEAWKAYLKWSLLNSATSLLSTPIEMASFDFYGKTLTGAIQQRPREDSALQTINGAVGEALGKLYVEKKFPAEAKVKA
ncbi:MAG: putative endopeptidase, partial [Flavobacteriales bacterium]